MFSLEQEEKWARELRECRLRLIKRVREASSLTSPTRRTALYQQWRAELGDNGARESAKFAEAVIAGRRSLYELERMV
jgi:hypothetical protein